MEISRDVLISKRKRDFWEFDFFLHAKMCFSSLTGSSNIWNCKIHVNYQRSAAKTCVALQHPDANTLPNFYSNQLYKSHVYASICFVRNVYIKFINSTASKRTIILRIFKCRIKFLHDFVYATWKFFLFVLSD